MARIFSHPGGIALYALTLAATAMPSTRKQVRFANDHRSSVSETAPCRKTHCWSRSRYCSRRDCHNELIARRDRRQLKKNTLLNQINTLLSTISERKRTIRATCDLAKWHGSEMRQATAAYEAIMATKIRAGGCTCVQCEIEQSDRMIEILKQKVKAAEKYLDVLRKYRNRYGLDDSSTVRAPVPVR